MSGESGKRPAGRHGDDGPGPRYLKPRGWSETPPTGESCPEPSGPGPPPRKARASATPVGGTMGSSPASRTAGRSAGQIRRIATPAPPLPGLPGPGSLRSREDEGSTTPPSGRGEERSIVARSCRPRYGPGRRTSRPPEPASASPASVRTEGTLRFGFPRHRCRRRGAGVRGSPAPFPGRRRGVPGRALLAVLRSGAPVPTKPTFPAGYRAGGDPSGHSGPGGAAVAGG